MKPTSIKTNSPYRNAFERYRLSDPSPIAFQEKSLKSIAQELSLRGLSRETIQNLQKGHIRKFSPEPSGYPSPQNISKLLLFNSISNPVLHPETVADGSQLGMLYTVNGLNQNLQYPWYWLSEDLAFDLVKTQPPEEIPHQIALPHVGIIILPSGTLLTSTGEVALISYHLLQPGEMPSFLSQLPWQMRETLTLTLQERQDNYRLSWIGSELSGYILGGVAELIPDASRRSLRLNTEGFDAWHDEEVERTEADCCLSVLLSALVYANQNQSQQTNEVAKPLGFGKPKENAAPTLRPIFIGQAYKSVIRRAGTGTHASPKVHWRKGHWKTVPVGEGRLGRDWRFIAPTLVMGDS